MTDDTSKLFKSKDTKEIQLENINFMSIQDFVEKLFKFNDSKKMQLKNIELILRIDEESKLLKSIDLIDRQFIKSK